MAGVGRDAGVTNGCLRAVADIASRSMRRHTVTMLAGRNPTRRNRNIGTAKQGYGQDNRLVVPTRHEHLFAFQCIGRYQVVKRQIEGECVNFIIEELNTNWVHSCTVDDVATVLSLIPAPDWVGIKTIIFRQPTRKQAIINSVWGRLSYDGEVFNSRNQVVASGPMIFLDAIDEGARLRRSTSLGPSDLAELDRLREDGHTIERVGRTYMIEVTLASARNTQLYRTLLHEVGHWCDWLEKVEEPCRRGEPYYELEERYFARPTAERETFAHRYADNLRKQLSDAGRIPLSR